MNNYNITNYIYAPYIPLYCTRIICVDCVIGVDTVPDRAIFNIYFRNAFLKYDYENNKAWNGCYYVKSKNRLKAIRCMCEKHIELAARNETELEYESRTF